MRKKIILPFVATCLDLEDIRLVLYSCLLWLFGEKISLHTVREEFWGPFWFFGDSKVVIPTDFSFPSPLQSHKWFIFVFRSVFQFSILNNAFQHYMFRACLQ